MAIVFTNVSTTYSYLSIAELSLVSETLIFLGCPLTVHEQKYKYKELILQTLMFLVTNRLLDIRYGRKVDFENIRELGEIDYVIKTESKSSVNAVDYSS